MRRNTHTSLGCAPSNRTICSDSKSKPAACNAPSAIRHGSFTAASPPRHRHILQMCKALEAIQSRNQNHTTPDLPIRPVSSPIQRQPNRLGHRQRHSKRHKPARTSQQLRSTIHHRHHRVIAALQNLAVMHQERIRNPAQSCQRRAATPSISIVTPSVSLPMNPARPSPAPADTQTDDTPLPAPPRAPSPRAAQSPHRHQVFPLASLRHRHHAWRNPSTPAAQPVNRIPKTTPGSLD